MLNVPLLYSEKKKSVISSKVAKVMLTRMSVSNDTSGSYRRTSENLERSQSSENSRRRLSNSPKRRDKQNSNSNHKLSSPRKLRPAL